MTTCLRCKSGKPTVCTDCAAELIDGATADLELSEAAEPSVGREVEDETLAEQPASAAAHFEELAMHKCQYGIPCNTPAGAIDCGEIATSYVWWGNRDNGLFVCEEHANAIEDAEASDEEEQPNG